MKKVQGAVGRGTAGTKRLAARGRKAIATVLKMKHIVEKSFYAMGRALADAAAHAVRARRAPSAHGGLVVSEEAKHFFAHLRAALKRAKLDVRVDEIAASESVGAKMRIVANVHDASKLAAALRAAES